MSDLYPKPGTFWRGAVPAGLALPVDTWARSFLKLQTGSTAIAVGLPGAVAGPAAGDHRKAWRGDATWADKLALASIIRASDDVQIFDFESLGDANNRLYAAAAASGGHKGRMGVRGTVDPFADFQIETYGTPGLVTHFGDPLQRVLRPLRCVTNQAFGATFTTQGLPTPTIFSPGAAPAALIDGSGAYVSLTYDFDTSAPAGIEIPACTRRGHNPQVVVIFRSALTQSRFWCGLLDGDPSGSASLGAIKGAAVRFDHAIDSGTLQFVTSDGSAQTVTSTGLGITANAIQAFRIAHQGGGSWVFASYDFATQSWVGFTVNSTNVPGTTDALGVQVKLGVTSTSNIDRALSPLGVWVG